MVISLRKIYIKIDGITCNHCREAITEVLLKQTFITKVIFDGNIAEIEYKGKLKQNIIIDSIIETGYYTNLKMISEQKRILKRMMSFKELLVISAGLILIAMLINKALGFNIFNLIPTVNSKTTYAMLFGIGVLTSIHCISMCGAINLVASTADTKNFKKPLLYNLGRLISYTLIGGLVGLLGMALTLNTYLQGMIIIIAAVLMFALGLNMMGIISLKLPSFKLKTTNNNSFIIGLLNGLMPCGPLQSMQVYALATGSFFNGAIAMFVFCLGTIPLMLFMGMISNLLNRNKREFLLKISTILIIMLSIVMFNRGLLNMGLDISNIFKPNYDNYLKAEIKEAYQVIEFDLSYQGYQDIVVQKDIPVKIIINANKKNLTGCNDSIVINAFNIKQELKIGENIIEFTPNKTGTFTYTCWMGMLKNNIVVVETID